MKTVLLSLILVVISTLGVNAQSFSLSINGEPLAADTIITVFPDPGNPSEITLGLIFHNNSNNGANIKVLRNEVSMLQNALSNFFWVAQYNFITDLSGQSAFIPAGGSSTDGLFTAYYYPYEAVGVSTVEYTFFNVANEDENVTITVKFDTTPQSIDESILKNSWMSDVYPNPATKFVNIDYKLPTEIDNASVKIVNLLGSVVKEQSINKQNNTLRMDVSSLNDGIYFYSVTINDEAYSTKKLIVR